jgi:hypothetical protein
MVPSDPPTATAPVGAAPALTVVTRHRVPAAGSADFLAQARTALALLGDRPGFIDGTIARAIDEPDLLVLTTRWVDVGSYRRALSPYDVKMGAVPLLSTALDEPTAFEILHSRGASGVVDNESALAADADDIGLGSAAAVFVPRLPS